MVRSKARGCLAIELAQAGEIVASRAAKGRNGFGNKFDLSRAEDLGMARQDLFDERCSRPRQSQHEHRNFAIVAGPAEPLEEFRRANLDEPRNQRLVS